MPIQPARYATATNPPEKKKATTVRILTRDTSQPLACAMPMQTPAICRPAWGLTSGLPGIGAATEITFPQFEQKRALGGSPAPHR
jgi:hypothetical protein